MKQSVTATRPSQSAALWGQYSAIVRAELLMQWRRLGFWFAFSIIFIIGIAATIYTMDLYKTTPKYADLSALLIANDFVNRTIRTTITFFGIIVSLLVADRVPRDKVLRMAELQQTTPIGNLVYVIGKFCGSFLAVLLPSFLTILFCSCFAFFFGATWYWFEAMVIAAVLVFIPVFAVVIAFVLLLSTFLPLRLIQVALPFLWLYLTSGSEAGGRLANLPFSVAGLVVLGHFFSPEVSGPSYTLQEVFANISFLLVCASIFLLVTIFCLNRRRERNVLV